jgi:hypothetical protein
MPEGKCKWTNEALFEHFSRLREADQLAIKAAHDAMNYRLAGMNEFRGTVEDLQTAMLTRKEAWSFLIGALGLVFGMITTAGAIIAVLK